MIVLGAKLIRICIYCKRDIDRRITSLCAGTEIGRWENVREHSMAPILVLPSHTGMVCVKSTRESENVKYRDDSIIYSFMF